MTNEKGQASQTWGTEEVSQLLHDSDSIGGMESISGTVRGIGVGIGRTNWEGDDSSIALLLGGIIEQLLENETQRLAEVRECVEWYEREDNVIQARIEKLKKLQEVAQRVIEPIDISTKVELTEEE